MAGIIASERAAIERLPARLDGFDGLRQERSRTVHLGQRIGKSSWPGSWKTLVSDTAYQLRWRRGGLEHSHDTPPYPSISSTILAHSSIKSLLE
jgi:hypothetical protein